MGRVAIFSRSMIAISDQLQMISAALDRQSGRDWATYDQSVNDEQSIDQRNRFTLRTALPKYIFILMMIIAGLRNAGILAIIAVQICSVYGQSVASPPAGTARTTSTSLLAPDTLPVPIANTVEGMLDSINAIRAQKDLTPLCLNENLMQVSNLHSIEQSLNPDQLSHINLAGLDPTQRANTQGQFPLCLENLASTDTAEGAMARLVESAGHLANIRNADVNVIGIAGVGTGNVIVQLFCISLNEPCVGGVKPILTDAAKGLVNGTLVTQAEFDNFMDGTGEDITMQLNGTTTTGKLPNGGFMPAVRPINLGVVNK